MILYKNITSTGFSSLSTLRSWRRILICISSVSCLVDKQQVLEIVDVTERLEFLMGQMESETRGPVKADVLAARIAPQAFHRGDTFCRKIP